MVCCLDPWRESGLRSDLAQSTCSATVQTGYSLLPVAGDVPGFP